MNADIDALIKKEGWIVEGQNEDKIIKAFGQSFKYTHPVNIYLKLYRVETNPDLKYQYMKAAHDYLWPKMVWHYWTERRFKTHCEGWNYISLAGGASTAKSFDVAKIVILFWLANPRKRGVIVASTTLESIQARIWGYITKLLKESSIPITYKYLGGQVPKILFPEEERGKGRDTIHGMFCVAAKKGDSDETINSWIGRHPDEALMVVLDECTDMPIGLTKAFVNLDSSAKPFQLLGIGNSNSKFDLHGSLSTPKNGWKSIDPMRDTKWETTQKNGICLFFSCYESPAIFEQDPERKKKLSMFLISQEQITEKERKLGKTSESFWRFVFGFWKSTSTDNTVISSEFMTMYDITKNAEFSGLHPLSIVGGLDPAFSIGGDQCILQLGVLGVDTTGLVVLDFRGEELLHRIKITATGNASEMQIASQVEDILTRRNCELRNVCVDGNGQGRALGSVIQLKMRSLYPPIKIYSVRTGSIPVSSFDVIIKDYHELWFAIRGFIEHGQIKGLGMNALQQFTTRCTKVTENYKVKLESKVEYKTRLAAIDPRMAHSPDEADSVALCLQAAIMQFGFYPGQRKEIVSDGFMDSKFSAYHQELKMQQEQHVVAPVIKAGFTANINSLVQYKRPFT